jgi:hypothetical protein
MTVAVAGMILIVANGLGLLFAKPRKVQEAVA